MVGKHRINCALHQGKRAHGEMDLDHMVIESCNTGMATTALELGPDRMYRWAKRLGFGEKTGIELAGETRGLLSSPDRWPRIQLANIGFGQGVAVTPIQLLSAYCAVANGGWLVQPHVVKAITDPNGRIEKVERPQPVRAVSDATAERMRRLLEAVVEEGTGKRARIPGRRVAGKTGTAQKPTPELGFRSGKYIGSFVGFAPADDPRLAILVVVDEPKNGHYGGVVAAPAFRAICERALTYLGVPPEQGVRERELALAGSRG
jgi:stage V sporulation protein D (sporulation-specific penicillin-binding protein)